jgi:hypothetical protein
VPVRANLDHPIYYKQEAPSVTVGPISNREQTIKGDDMSAILKMLTSQLGDSALDQISQQLGADRSTTEKAVPAAMATLLGGLARNSASSQGAESLFSALSNDHDGGVLDNIGDLLGDASAGPGAGILRHVLGGKQAAVESGLGRSTGLEVGSAGKLLTMLAPLVMGALGRNQRENNLDPAGLASMLSGEHKSIEKEAPDAFGMVGQLLDSDGDGQIMDDVAKIGGGLFKKFLGG